MSVDGSIVNEYVEKEAIQGSDVVLTIDANLQRITEKALKDTINNIKNRRIWKKISSRCGGYCSNECKFWRNTINGKFSRL